MTELGENITKALLLLKSNEEISPKLVFDNVYTQIHGLFQFATFFQFLKVANWKKHPYELHDNEVI